MSEFIEKNRRIISIVIIVIVVAIVLFTGKVTAKFGDDGLELKASLTTGMTVSYDSIISVERQSDMVIGTRSFGVGSMRLQAGTFTNDAFGTYTLYSYADNHEYIVMETDLGYVVFNLATEAETESAYTELMAHIS